MKNRLRAVTILIIFTAVLAWACAPSPPATFNSKGIITALDPGTRNVTIDHEDIPGLMRAMEMDFLAADASVLSGFAVGDTVTFVLERSGDEVVLLRLTKADDTPKISGADIYAVNCAECHGGKGEGAKKGIPFISGHALVHSEEEFIQQVNNGKDDKMPAFRDKLTPQEVAAVVKYIRTVIQAGAKPDPKHQH